MSRRTLTLPTKLFDETFCIPVRITDINYGNHLGNDSIVSIIQEARMQWLHQWGYTELNVEGVGLIMADLAVEFISEGFYGDLIEVALGVDNLSRASFDLYYKLAVMRNEEVLIAKAKTGMVFYDYAKKKVTAMPNRFRVMLNVDVHDRAASSELSDGF